MPKEIILKLSNQNKLRFKVLSYIMLILSIISFATFNETNSKYIKETDFETGLKYTNEFYTMLPTDGVTNTKEILTNNAEKITARFSFNRNKITKQGEKETYTIVIDNACSITSLTESSNTATINKSQKTITYSTPTEATINFSVECNVASLPQISNGNKIQISYSVKEKVEEDFTDIEYFRTNISADLIRLTNQIRIPKTSTNIYEDFKEMLIKEYFPGYVAGKYEKTSTIDLIEKAIINNADPSKEYIAPLQGVQTFSQLLTMLNGYNYIDKIHGMTVETSDPEYIVFNIQDTFNGYAVTYTNDSYDLFFSYSEVNESTKEKVKNIFKEYVDYFYRNLTPEDKASIDAYIEKNDIADFILNSGNSIMGLNKLKRDNNLVSVNISNLLEASKITNTLPIKIESNRMSMLVQFEISTSIDNCISNGECKYLNLQNSIIEKLKTDEKLIQSYSKNNIVSGPVSNFEKFDDYYIVQGTFNDYPDKYQYVMVHIYSIGTAEADGKVYTYIDLKVLPESENYKLNIITNDETKINSLQMTLLVASVEAKEECLSAIKEIYNLVGQTIDEEALKMQVSNATTDTPIEITFSNVTLI